MELSEADRLCLVEAETHGRLTAPILRQGRTVPEGVALQRHLDDMVRRGLLARSGEARGRGASLMVDYEATDAGLALKHAVETRDQALELLAEVRGALAMGGVGEVRRLLEGPRWRALLKSAEPPRRH